MAQVKETMNLVSDGFVKTVTGIDYIICIYNITI